MDHTGRRQATLAGDDQREVSSRPEVEHELGTAALLVIVAFAAGVVAQGGFHPAGRWLVAVPVAIAGVLIARAPVTPRGAAPVFAGLLCGWIVVRGASVDELGAAIWRVAAIALVAVVVSASRRGAAGDRDALSAAVLIGGVAVSVTGWVGVALHREPWAVAGGSTWRAASTLTYPNAAAALVVMVWLVHLAGRAAAHTDRARGSAAASAVLLAGALATQSRAGAIACIAGLGALVSILGARRVARAAVAPCAGATVAFAGLVPGLAAGSAPAPVTAFASLVAGAAVAEAVERARRSPRPAMRRVAVGTLALAALGAVSVASEVSLGDRLDLVSSDRAGTNRAALDVIGAHPLAGVGPGRVIVAFPVNGGLVGTDLVHDEYLQLVAEIGLVGAALAAVIALAGVRVLARARSSSSSATWAGCVSGLVAFAVHSGFDFLWHIPVVVVLAAVLFGLATAGVGPADLTPTTREESP